MFFILSQKLFSFLRYLNFLEFLNYFKSFDRVTKQFDQRDEINCKFYDVTAWLKQL